MTGQQPSYKQLTKSEVRKNAEVMDVDNHFLVLPKLAYVYAPFVYLSRRRYLEIKYPIGCCHINLIHLVVTFSVTNLCFL